MEARRKNKIKFQSNILLRRQLSSYKNFEPTSHQLRGSLATFIRLINSFRTFKCYKLMRTSGTEEILSVLCHGSWTDMKIKIHEDFVNEDTDTENNRFEGLGFLEKIRNFWVCWHKKIFVFDF